MHDYSPSSRWLQKGDFVDLESLDPEHRPEGRSARFYSVRKQILTTLRPIKFGTELEEGQTVTADVDQEGQTSQTNRLVPENSEMILQCAVGLKNNFKLWVEQPVDYSMRKLPNETPNLNDDVGMVRMQDSPYYDPNLAATEFWVVKDKADDPTFHAVKETGGPIQPIISLRVNELMLQPVTDSQVVEALKSYRLKSTPVDLEVVA